MFGSWRRRKESPVVASNTNTAKKTKRQPLEQKNNTEKQSNLKEERTEKTTSPDPQQLSEQKPLPDKSPAREESNSLPSTQELQEEYERKIRVLSQCLSEKAEENITLHEQLSKQQRTVENLQKEVESAKDLEVVVSELNSMLRDKNQDYESLKADAKLKDKERLELQQLNQEFQRRIRVLSTCLEEMAQENLGYQSETTHSSLRASAPTVPAKKAETEPQPNEPPSIEVKEVKKEAPVSGSVVEAKLVELTRKQDEERNDEERLALEKELTLVKEELQVLEEKLQKKEKRIVQLNTKLMDAVNKKNALAESNDLYEEKLKSLERELTENLQQEGIRRQEAEYVASKLKKKVAELQFLLDERDQDSDSSYYSEDEDFD